MNKKRIFGVLALAVSLLIVGCTIKPIYNVAESPVASPKGNVTQDDVRKAIMQAGLALGWKMEPSGPGAMVGTLTLREHVAVVDIRYSAKSYSIKYKDSKNLGYDGANNIHRNYNGWVQNLDNRIQILLSGM